MVANTDFKFCLKLKETKSPLPLCDGLPALSLSSWFDFCSCVCSVLASVRVDVTVSATRLALLSFRDRASTGTRKALGPSAELDPLLFAAANR